MATLPNGLISFGPDANCTLELCPIEWSVYTYRPSLVANIALPIIFGVLGLIHTYLGIRWKSWGFMVGMQLGSVSAIIGYGGRIMMYNDPFSFAAFIMQTRESIKALLQLSTSYCTVHLLIPVSSSSLPYSRPRLLHCIDIRHSFQDCHFLRPQPFQIQAETILLDLSPSRYSLPYTTVGRWRVVIYP